MPLKPFIIAIKGQLCCPNNHYGLLRILQTSRLGIFIFFSNFSLKRRREWLMQCQATKRKGPKEKKTATSTKVNGEQTLRERVDSGLHL